MERRKHIWTGLLYSLLMLLLILDAKTAVAGASEGVLLCIRTVIPSLFPFFIFGILICTSLSGVELKLLQPLCRLCRIPKGAGSLLVLGFLGGYPIGAQSVYSVYQSGGLGRNDARRLLGFCSNAGPAFIFGMTSSLFTSAGASWLLWAVHMASAIISAVLLPGSARNQVLQRSTSNITVMDAVEKSIRAIGRVCAWVVVFRVIISILSRWILWIFPTDIQVIIAGILELTNGCTGLYSIPQQGMRFVLCSGFLGFGGVCVMLQTLSVTGDLGIRTYLIGKIFQLLISIMLSYIVQAFLFHGTERIPLNTIPIAALVFITGIFAVFLRKNSSILAVNGV